MPASMMVLVNTTLLTFTGLLAAGPSIVVRPWTLLSEVTMVK